MSMTPTPEARTEQVRPLRERRADQQAAVAASEDRQPLGVRVVLADQVFRRGDEVVEHICLRRFGAGLVPFLAVLAAAAQVRDRVHAAHLEPALDRRAERRRQRDVETP